MKINRDLVVSKRVIPMRGERYVAFPLRFEDLVPKARVMYLQIMQDNNLDVWYEVGTIKRYPSPGKVETYSTYSANGRSTINCLEWSLPPDDDVLVEVVIRYSEENENSQFTQVIGEKVPTLPEAPSLKLVDKDSPEYKDYIENYYVGDLLYPELMGELADMSDEQFISTVGKLGISDEDAQSMIDTINHANQSE